MTLDGGFFVFGDLSVKVEGDYRLRFSLYEMLKWADDTSIPLGLLLTSPSQNRSGIHQSDGLVYIQRYECLAERLNS